MNHDDVTTPGMIMRGPATRWEDACPTGNGAIGAMLYGQICSERILLNHEALYRPSPSPALCDVSGELPEVRRLIAEKQYKEAGSHMAKVHAERTGEQPARPDPYQPFCELRIAGTTQGAFRHYRRGVDFDTGRAWVRWDDDHGRGERELFVSQKDDTVYLRMRATGAVGLSCRIGFAEVPDDRGGRVGDGKGGEQNGAVCVTSAEAEGWLSFNARYEGSFAFGAIGNVWAPGGTMRADGDAIVIENAQEVVVRTKLFVDGEAAARANALRDGLASDAVDFDAAFAAHRAIHAEIFNRVRLDLGVAERESNEEMLMDAYDDKASIRLVQTMFEYGRYLLICSSRPGGWPANLQGIWNGSYAPAWEADFHTDENIQMNYWQALPGAMPETALPFFEYFERFLDEFRDNARRLYGCRGIFVPLAMTTRGAQSPRNWFCWTAAAGWMAQHFYDHWLFTGDEKFLAAHAIPWLRETALFYEDFLFEDETGRLCFSPSLSPENTPSGEGMNLVTMNATMDVAICREVLANLIEGCTHLGIEEDGVSRWQALLKKLPPYEVNEDGAMREWLHPEFKDNYHHRHQSHIYPLFPGREVTEESSPALYEACRVAVEKRLVIGLTSQTGWSMAHMANIYARLGDGDRALDCIDILTRGSTGPNLFAYHNDWRDMGLSLFWRNDFAPFQIDANFGISAAILEMLVFSTPGMIKLLPALPTPWPIGSVKGIACRGGVSVAIEWDIPAGRIAAVLTGRTDGRIRLKLPMDVPAVEVNGKQRETVDRQPGACYCDIDLAAGKVTTVVIGKEWS